MAEKNRIFAVWAEEQTIGLSDFLIEGARKTGSSFTIVYPLPVAQLKPLIEWMERQWEFEPISPPTFVFVCPNLGESAVLIPSVLMEETLAKLRRTGVVHVAGSDSSLPSEGRVVFMMKDKDSFPMIGSATDSAPKKHSTAQQAQSSQYSYPSHSTATSSLSASSFYANDTPADSDSKSSKEKSEGSRKGFVSIRFFVSKDLLTRSLELEEDDPPFDYCHGSPRYAVRPLFLPMPSPDSKAIGKRRNFVICGTPSSGKTTVARMIEAVGYKVIPLDDHMWWSARAGDNREAVGRKTLPHIKQFGTYDRESGEEYSRIIKAAARGAPVVVFDTIGKNPPFFSKDEDHFVIQLYAPLDDMIRNFVARFATDDSRGIAAFRHYGDMYKATTDKAKSIDTVSRRSAREMFLQIAGMFRDQRHLDQFVGGIFHQMGIDDDGAHPIAPDESCCHFTTIVSTKGKDPVTVFKEVLAIIEKELGKH